VAVDSIEEISRGEPRKHWGLWYISVHNPQKFVWYGSIPNTVTTFDMCSSWPIHMPFQNRQTND
jgi:hypothetical protein